MMKSILEDIGDQLRMCAALMSDPELLREQPHVVASQFKVAASRIEQLKAFLEKPPRSVSQEKPWFDKTVLDGVYRLVDATLRRHLRPLAREHKFPVVFERDLYNARGEGVDEDKKAEHMLKREIRETNCVGALITLYYLLYWHLALILLNRSYHPACYADVEIIDDGEEEDKVDPMGDLLGKLPKDEDLLEYRRFGKGVANTRDGQAILFADKGQSKRITSTLFDRMEVRDGHGAALNTRHTPAINVLRQVLSSEFCHESEKEQVEISAKLHCLLGLCISTKLDLFAGVISTFDLQDDVDKWEDMYAPKNIQSTDGAGFAQYSYRLARVLKTLPYQISQDDFQSVAKPAAVYDYGSVALMVDISKSFVTLARLVEGLLKPAAPAAVHSALGQLMMQVYYRKDDSVRIELGGRTEAKDTTVYHESGFIQHTPGWRRAALDLKKPEAIGINGASVIDNLAGYYWGARPCGVEQFNHQYLACPMLKIDPQTDTPMLNRLQAISAKQGEGNVRRAFYAMTHLTALHRNSLYVRSICQTLAKIAAILKPHLGGIAILIDCKRVLRPDPHCDLTAVATLDPKFVIGGAIPGAVGNPADEKALTLAVFQKHLKAETDALDAGIKQARSASSYPGISWPVVYGRGRGENNINAFERVHAIPRPTPPLVESADTAARAMDMIARAGFVGMDREAIVRDVAANILAQGAAEEV